jgi:hypothetical protein
VPTAFSIAPTRSTGAGVERRLGLCHDLGVQVFADPERGLRQDRIGERDGMGDHLRPVGGQVRQERRGLGDVELRQEDRADLGAFLIEDGAQLRDVHRREAGPWVGAVADGSASALQSVARHGRDMRVEDLERVMHAARHDQREVVERAGELAHDIGQRGAVDLAQARHGARQHALMRGRELVDAGGDAMRSNSRTITAAFCRRVIVAGVMSVIGPSPSPGPCCGISPIVIPVRRVHTARTRPWAGRCEEGFYGAGGYVPYSMGIAGGLAGNRSRTENENRAPAGADARDVRRLAGISC